MKKWNESPSEVPVKAGDYVRLLSGSMEERGRIFLVSRLGETRYFGGKTEQAALDPAGKAFPVSDLEVVGRTR